MSDIFVWIGHVEIVGTDLALTCYVMTTDGDHDAQDILADISLSSVERNAHILETVRANCVTQFGTAAGKDELIGGFPGPAWTRIDKLVTTSRTNNTLTDDPDFQFVAEAGQLFQIRLMVFFTTAANADFKYRVVFTGGETYMWRSILRGAGGAVPAHVAMIGGDDGADVALTGTGSEGSIHEEIALSTGAGGTFKFQWAQNTTQVTSTEVLAGSYLEYHRVS